MRTRSDLANNADAFVPKEDVIKKLDDGREIQVAAKGVPVPRAEALRLGLVKPETDAEKAAVEDAEQTPADLHNEQIAAKRGAGPTENKAAGKK